MKFFQGEVTRGPDDRMLKSYSAMKFVLIITNRFVVTST